MSLVDAVNRWLANVYAKEDFRWRHIKVDGLLHFSTATVVAGGAAVQAVSGYNVITAGAAGLEVALPLVSLVIPTAASKTATQLVTGAKVTLYNSSSVNPVVINPTPNGGGGTINNAASFTLGPLSTIDFFLSSGTTAAPVWLAFGNQAVMTVAGQPALAAVPVPWTSDYIMPAATGAYTVSIPQASTSGAVVGTKLKFIFNGVNTAIVQFAPTATDTFIGQGITVNTGAAGSFAKYYNGAAGNVQMAVAAGLVGGTVVEFEYLTLGNAGSNIMVRGLGAATAAIFS